MSMRILRAATRIASPWKNGGGTTFEVAAFPEESSLDNFGWRISMAEVRQAGPFSKFPDVDRKLAILEGRLSLAVEGRTAVELSTESDVVSFPGDVPTSSQPLSSSVTDLNLMTRRDEFSADMTRHRGGEPLLLTLARSEVAAVVALSSLEVGVSGNRFELGARDAVLLSRGDGRSVEFHPASQGSGFFVIRILPAK